MDEAVEDWQRRSPLEIFRQDFWAASTRRIGNPSPLFLCAPRQERLVHRFQPRAQGYACFPPKIAQARYISDTAMLFAKAKQSCWIEAEQLEWPDSFSVISDCL